jgi:gliding motility-associated-like protein
MNMDGSLDLILTATFDNNVQLFINQSTLGNISFAAPQLIPTSLGPWGVDISDIDGDGDPDIIVANRNENKVNVLRQDASLTFTKLDLTTAKPPRNVRVGDYDGDGKPDIAFTSFSGLSFSVDVLRNTNCVSPKILNTAPVTVCTAQTIRLSTTPALNVTFDWSRDGVSFQSGPNEYADITLAASTPGYTVKVTGESGACVITSPPVVAVANPGSPPADPGITTNSPLCIGSNLTLQTPAVGGATYDWTGPGGFTSTAQNPTVNSVTVTNAGIYYLQVTASGCSSNKVSSQVDLASLPAFTITSSVPGAGCQGSPITLSVNNAAGYTYQWKKDGSVLGGQTGLTLAVSQEGDYTVAVTSTSPVCSAETAASTVILLSVPVANFQSPATACTGIAAAFTDQSTLDVRGTASYAWTFGDGNTSTAQNPSNTYTSAGSLNVSLTAGYVGVAGCTNMLTRPISVTTPVIPVITSSANPICPGDSTTLSVAGTFNSFDWSVGGTANSILITDPSDYTVNTQDQNNCASTATITINSKPTFSLTVSAGRLSINLGDTTQLIASGADSYAWTPSASLDNPAIANPIAKPTATTSYEVTGTKAGFCNALDSVTVSVSGGGTPTINAPLIFSPNGDVVNDTWIIPGVDPECTMVVYDGHGSKIFETKGYNNTNSWDGTYNGKPVPDGTYFYVCGCPNLHPATGNVLVVR